MESKIIDDKVKILNEIKKLSDKVSKKDSEINKLEIELRQNIDKTFSEKEKILSTIKSLHEENYKLKNESNKFLKNYNEYLKRKNRITSEYNSALSKLKKKFEQKEKVRDILKNEIKKEYETQINKIKDIRYKLLFDGKKEGGILERLGLKKNYDVVNKEKEEKIKKAIEKMRDEFQTLFIEKLALDQEYNNKIENIGNKFSIKSNLEKHKGIIDRLKQIRNNAKDLEGKDENNELIIEELVLRIKDLEKERDELNNKIIEKEKAIGGLRYPIYKLKLLKITDRLKLKILGGGFGGEEIKKIYEKPKAVSVPQPSQTITPVSKKKEPLQEEVVDEIEKGIEEDKKKEDLEESFKVNLQGLGIKRGLVRKCEILIQKGYKALNEDKLKKASEIFMKLKKYYSKLPNIEKLAINDQIYLFGEKIKQRCQLEMQEEDERYIREELKR